VQTPALADGEAVHPVVTAEHVAGRGVDDVAGRGAQPRLEEARGVAVGHEAQVVAVGLVGHGEAARGGLDPHLRLGARAQREQRPPQLPRLEDGEHVGLVLGRIDGAVQLDAVGPRREPGVVAGGHRVEAEGEARSSSANFTDSLQRRG
jgi:hypothetical protein